MLHHLRTNAYSITCVVFAGVLLVTRGDATSPAPAGTTALPAAPAHLCPSTECTSLTFQETIYVCEKDPASEPTDGEIRAIAEEYEVALVAASFNCNGADGVPPCDPPGGCTKVADITGLVFDALNTGVLSSSTGHSETKCNTLGATYIDGGEILDSAPGGGGTYRVTVIFWEFTGDRIRNCNCPDS